MLLYASSQVQELWIDYSQCYTRDVGQERVVPNEPIKRYDAVFKSNQQLWDQNPPTYVHNTIQAPDAFGRGPGTYQADQCTLQFEIPEDIAPPVYMYYRLTNYYQNHRRYVKSYYQDQLKGKDISYNQLSACDPLRTPADNHSAIYFPCGLIANSLFNDSYSLPVLLNPSDSSAPSETYNMTNQNIAWSSDADLYGATTQYSLSNIVPPPNWQTMYPLKIYNEDYPPPNLKEWEEFQNWMRTAGLPTFSKLILRNDHETLKKGRYEINITDSMNNDCLPDTSW